MASRSDLSSVHVVVPVRGAGEGKSRLGEAIDAEERIALVVGMLLASLDTLSSWESCAAAYVVTNDPAMRAVTKRSAPVVSRVRESAAGGLNGALVDGRRAALAAGATAILFLPADLPLLTPQALDKLLEAADAALAAGQGAPVVVVAPSDARIGTNALLLSPPTVIEPQFGEHSLEAHLRAASEADASVQLVREPELGFDLDTPQDLERLDFARLVELQRIGQGAIDLLSTQPMDLAEPLVEERLTRAEAI